MIKKHVLCIHTFSVARGVYSLLFSCLREEIVFRNYIINVFSMRIFCKCTS